MYKIYKHTVADGRVYIGITGQQPEYRWNSGKGYANNQPFFNVIVAEGWNNIKHEILEEVPTLEEAKRKEAEYILQYKSHLSAYGFNVQAPTFKNKIKKVFVCDETGQVFYSLKEAADFAGVSGSAISHSISRGGVCKGFHWHVEMMEI